MKRITISTKTGVVYDGFREDKAAGHEAELRAASVESKRVEVEIPDDQVHRVVIHTKLPLPAPFVFQFPTAARAKAFYDRTKVDGFQVQGLTVLPNGILAIALEAPEGVTVTPAPAVMLPGAQQTP